jgi:hypothetical protein
MRTSEVKYKQQGDIHAHHRGWIIYWRQNQNSSTYDLWIDDDKGVECFVCEDCLNIDKAIELASRAINAVIDGDFMTKAKYFDPLSSFNNSLARQIWRSEEGLDPIIDIDNYNY